VHRLNCFFLSIKISQVLSEKKRQQRNAFTNMLYQDKSKAKEGVIELVILGSNYPPTGICQSDL